MSKPAPPNTLPIHSVADQIAAILQSGNRLVLSAPTGSGKTTQVPQILYRRRIVAGQIIVLQPRRLAARLVARRVAAEMACEVGELVGYQTRHDSRISPQTVIRFMTEGLFLRLVQANPTLGGVGAVILDEFHERNLASDVALALVKVLQESQRRDLRLVVMSATLDTKLVAEYLGCAAVSAEGRMYPVDLRYLEHRAKAPAWELAADALVDLLNGRTTGDVLIFMPGGYEIRRTIDACRRALPDDELAFFPLSGELPPSRQDAAVAPSKQRKVIVSTNVAETSITIEGICHVIDSGIARVNRFDPRRGINVLLLEPISQASAQQRAGRAGRTAPGTCTRLWTAAEQRSRPAHATPEIQRLDLAEVVLQLKSYGIVKLGDFPWLQSPAPAAISQAVDVLRMIGALDGEERLTAVGRTMAALPMHPRLSRMLVEASQRGCLDRAALWAAVIGGRDIFIGNAGKEFTHALPAGHRTDFIVIERALQAARDVDFDARGCEAMGLSAPACRDLDRTVQLFRDAAQDVGLRAGRKHSGDEAIKCLLVGFPDHLGVLRPGAHRACGLVGQRRGQLDAHSVVSQSGLILPVEISEIGSGPNIRTALSMASEIDSAWLDEVYPKGLRHDEATIWNEQLKCVERVRRTMFLDLIIEQKPLADIDSGQAAELLADLVIRGQLKLEGWDEKVEQWIARARCVGQWFSERKLLTYTDDDRRLIIEDICQGATRYSQIKDRPCYDTVRNAMPWDDQRFIEQMAPERIELRNGWKMKVEYQSGSPPRGRAKIQDFYDMKQTPTVAGGRVKVLLEILGPNFRPVQTTDDLAGFWKNLYPTIRKELSRKYPRHEWR